MKKGEAKRFSLNITNVILKLPTFLTRKDSWTLMLCEQPVLTWHSKCCISF